MTSLFRQKFGFVVKVGIVSIKKDFGFLKDFKFIEIALVFADGLRQIGQQGRADKTFVRRRRRRELKHPFGIGENGVDTVVFHPGIGIDFLHAAAKRQIFFNPVREVFVALIDSVLKSRRKGRRFKIIIAIHPGNFFHDVVDDGDIAGGTPCRRGHVHVVAVNRDGKAQAFQFAFDFIITQLFSQTAGQPVKADVNLCRFELFDVFVAIADNGHVGILFFE